MSRLSDEFDRPAICCAGLSQDDLMKILGIGAAIGSHSDNISIAKRISKEIAEDRANITKIYDKALADLKAGISFGLKI